LVCSHYSSREWLQIVCSQEEFRLATDEAITLNYFHPKGNLATCPEMQLVFIRLLFMANLWFWVVALHKNIAGFMDQFQAIEQETNDLKAAALAGHKCPDSVREFLLQDRNLSPNTILNCPLQNNCLHQAVIYIHSSLKKHRLQHPVHRMTALHQIRSGLHIKRML
jgi:hypothetical protein